MWGYSINSYYDSGKEYVQDEDGPRLYCENAVRLSMANMEQQNFCVYDVADVLVVYMEGMDISDRDIAPLLAFLFRYLYSLPLYSDTA